MSARLNKQRRSNEIVLKIKDLSGNKKIKHLSQLVCPTDRGPFLLSLEGKGTAGKKGPSNLVSPLFTFKKKAR